MYLLTNFSSWLLPLSIFSVTGATISFMSPILGLNSRWMFTILLFILVFSRFRFQGLLNTKINQIILLNIFWASLTIAWSEVPLLSAMKVFAYGLMTITFFYSSYVWVIRSSLQRAVDFLWLTVLFTFLAAILGLGSARANVATGAADLYQGLVDGPNMMGSLLMMCTPLLLWRCYAMWKKNEWRIFWVSCLIVEFIFLMKANSRAALVASLFCVISIVYSLGYRKWVPIVTSIFMLILTLLLISPDIYDRAVSKYVFKSASEQQGVLYTRATVWEESFRLAKLGGLFGGGYGVTIGDESFKGGLTSVGYGREKGNSQMAIAEEVGLIGLVFYLIFIFSLYTYQVKMFFLTRNKHLRVLLGISMGMITGLIFQSVFEAWWVSPGSPEFVYFWAIVGFSLGACQLIKQDYRQSLKKQENVINQSGYD